jgi:hypothetical protein
MLVVNKLQEEVFRQRALKQFEDEMVIHCKDFSSKLFNTINVSQVRLAIRDYIFRAEQYGFTNAGPVRLFIELAFLLGSSFDTDPQYPWACMILSANSSLNQMEKSDVLYRNSLEYINNVFGHEFSLEKAALQRFTKIEYNEFENIAIQPPEFIFDKITDIYPEKSEFVGKLGITTLYATASRIACNYSLNKSVGVLLVFAFLFTFGHGCFTDLQYPWISSTLLNPSIIDTDKRVKLLYSKMMVYCEKALDSFNE